IQGQYNTPTLDGRFHPSLGFFEAVYEAGDGLGAARSVLRDASHRGGMPPHVLITQVYRDEAVPNQASEPLGATLGLVRVSLSVSTPGLRFAPMNTVPAPYTPASGPTAAFVQYHPGTHDLIQFTHGLWNYDMNFPPWMALPSPISVPNPTAKVHRQVERFLVDYFGGLQPTVIDPFL